MATAATIGPVEILRVELERLYDLDALQTLVWQRLQGLAT